MSWALSRGLRVNPYQVPNALPVNFSTFPGLGPGSQLAEVRIDDCALSCDSAFVLENCHEPVVGASRY